jgi:hypothetical protein
MYPAQQLTVNWKFRNACYCGIKVLWYGNSNNDNVTKSQNYVPEHGIQNQLNLYGSRFMTLSVSCSSCG